MRCFIVLSGLILALVMSAPAGYPESMVVVPAGTFIMGDGEAYCGVDEHEVTLTRGFYLGQHEATNQEYLEAVQWAYEHGYVTATISSVRDNLDGSTLELLRLHDEDCEIQFDGAGTFYLRESTSSYAQSAYPGGYDPADHPVKEVTWYGAVRYCDWLSLQTGLPRAYEHTGDWSCNSGDPYGAQGYRLPTDAEWEYAAQFDDERIYPWGDEDPDCSWANFYYSSLCVGWTSPMGSYPDAPDALDLSDMAGNVFEWCNDWRVCALGTDPVTDPPGPGSGTSRVIRGGSWYDYLYDLPCASRFGSTPSYGYLSLGFRAVRTVDPSHTDGGTEPNHSRLFLGNALPNPFTVTTQITYAVPRAAARSPVLLNVFDPTGRLVRTLVEMQHQSGQHSITWDATDQAGWPVEGGIYFYRLSVGGETMTKRMILVR